MKNYVYAGFWDRFIMYLFDVMIIAGINYLFSIVFKVNNGFMYQPGTIAAFYAKFYVIFPVIYFPVMWILFGGSIAYLFRQIKIVDARTGEKPPFWKMIIRYITFPISIPLLGLGVLWMLWDSHNQTWHDKFSGTIVVKRKTFKRKDLTVENIENLVDEQKTTFPLPPAPRDKTLWKVGIVFAVISLFACAGISYILNYDEELSSSAGEWLYEEPFVETDPQDNAYYYLVGFEASKDQSAFNAGFDFVNNENDIVSGRAKRSQFPDENSIIKISPIDEGNFGQDAYDALKNPEIFQKFMSKNRDKLNSYFSDNTVLINRLNRISAKLEKGYYKETIIDEASVKIPVLVTYITTIRFLLTIYADDYVHSDKKEALEKIAAFKDDGLTLVRESQSILTYLIYRTTVLLTLDTYNLLLELDPQNSRLHQEISNISPISQEEMPMQKIAKHDFRYYSSYYLNMFNPNKTIYSKDKFHISEDDVVHSKSIIFKPGMTLNQEYKYSRNMEELSSVQGKDFYKNFARLSAIHENTVFDYIRNPFGSAIVNIARPSNGDYYITKHDINGRITLLKLKSEIYSKKIAESDVADFIEANNTEYYNPFTLVPIKFNEQSNEIYYLGPDENFNPSRKLSLSF